MYCENGAKLLKISYMAKYFCKKMQNYCIFLLFESVSG